MAAFTGTAVVVAAVVAVDAAAVVVDPAAAGAGAAAGAAEAGVAETEGAGRPGGALGKHDDCSLELLDILWALLLQYLVPCTHKRGAQRMVKNQVRISFDSKNTI